MNERLLAALREAVGAESAVTDRAVLVAHEVDWTGRFRGKASALVRPGSADEVGQVLRACAAAGVGVVPQGGNTGLVAGAVPHDAVVLSTGRLDALGQPDPGAAELTAGAGATLERVQRAAIDAGRAFGVDLAARGSATIGGMIATDAGGIHRLRYGSMRRQVLGLEAVLADGSVVHELPGYDLVDLVAGSEGTLAVITEARLRLVPSWSHRATALISVDDIAGAVAAAAHATATSPELEAVEFVDAASLALAAARGGQAVPFGRPGPALLVEVAGDQPMLDVLTAALSVMPGLRDAVLADDGPGRRRLWALREGVTEAIASVGVPHKLDVGLPMAKLAGFVETLGPMVERAHGGARVFVFGHLAVGNLHVNVVGPPPDDERVDDAVLRLVADLGGEVAAEHGIGRAKARWLRLARSPRERAMHARIKGMLDPAGVLNPGVLQAGPPLA
ncbi:MAG TPA: FAD-binding oxidoreductase [Candidatus Limnocylindrales bacterium]|nr:FAD-binding oxidoreductase [Candidatus Limnocylindrales bacterium]